MEIKTNIDNILKEINKETRDDIIEIELENMLNEFYKEDILISNIVNMSLTWFHDELINCVRLGYTLIATYTDVENNLGKRYNITDPYELKSYIDTYGKKFRPRYIHYKNFVHMHIEKFVIRENPGPRPLRDAETIHEINRILYNKHRMSKAKYEKLTKLIENGKL